MEVVGYTPEGEAIVVGDEMDGEVMGVRARHGHHRVMRIPPKPGWRAQLAPGVIQPDEGMVPLPLAPQANGGVFDSTFTQITFQGQLQKPFRGERALISVVRNGPTSTGRLLTQMFVGTDLQQADITAFDLELIGQATAFGTRTTMKAAEPGVLIRFIVTVSSALANTDSIFASVLLMGRIIH